MDFGFLGPPETDSSDEEMYTGGSGRPRTEPDLPRVDSIASTSRFKYQKLPSPTRRQLFEVSFVSVEL